MGEGPKCGCTTRVTVPPKVLRCLLRGAAPPITSLHWPSGTPEASQDREGMPQVPLLSPVQMSGCSAPASVTLSLTDVRGERPRAMDSTLCLQSLLCSVFQSPDSPF